MLTIADGSWVFNDSEGSCEKPTTGFAEVHVMSLQNHGHVEKKTRLPIDFDWIGTK